MIEIQFKFFGAFRKYFNQTNVIVMSFQKPISVGQIKSELTEKLKEISSEFKLNGDQLIFDSAIANEQEILLNESMLVESCHLSILPPVCGG